MRPYLLLLLLFVLFLGGCAVFSRTVQPTIHASAQAWVASETRTDPLDDLVRFRQAEARGRRSALLLPLFILLTAVLLLVLLTLHLPAILKEWRLLRRSPRRRGRRPPGSAHPARPDPGWPDAPGFAPPSPTSRPVLPLAEASHPPDQMPTSDWWRPEEREDETTAYLASKHALPPPYRTDWLEED